MVDVEKIQANWPGWTIVRKLGQGGFGAVYEIERDVFGETEKAALKTISIPQNEDDIEELKVEGYDNATITHRYHSYLENIVKEYSTMAKLKGHPNVVYCDDIKYIQHDDGFGWDIYIKMELLTPILQCIDQISDEQSVISLGVSIANALTACARHNIIHRDIKPQNIFVSSDGTFKLGDFGIAKTVDHATSGTKIGTMRYIAPEVYRGLPYGAAADQYSLGLVLYWLLNDRRIPFLPKLATAAQEESARARRLMGEQIPPPTGGSPELQAIVLKACAYDPAKRFASAEEMMNALKALQMNTGEMTFNPTELMSETVALYAGTMEETSLFEPQPQPDLYVDLSAALMNQQIPKPDPVPQPVYSQPIPKPDPVSKPVQTDYTVPQPATDGKKGVPILPIVLGGIALIAGIIFLVVFLKGRGNGPDIPPETKETQAASASESTTAETTAEPTTAETTVETETEEESSTETEPSSDEETSEETESETEDAAAANVMSYDEFMAAEPDAEVTIEAYIQSILGWEDNLISVYAQDEDGGYSLPDMICYERDAERLIPGTKIRATGYKEESRGQIQIRQAKFSVIDDDNPYIAEPFDATLYLGTDELIRYQNQFVSLRGLTVVPREGRVFTYYSDNSGTDGDDLFLDTVCDGANITLKVESRVSDGTSAVYNAVKDLNIGDVIDVEGILFWWRVPYLMITDIK